MYEELLEYINGLDVIDTHEHLPCREKHRPANDVLAEYLSGYFGSDLVSAGMSGEQQNLAMDSSKPLAQRWKMVEPFWQAAKNTAYARVLNMAAADLYGIDRIDTRTIGPLNEAFQTFRAKGGCYRKVLREKGRIKLSILDVILPDNDFDAEFFRPTLRVHAFVQAGNNLDLAAIARRAGMKGIHRLSDLEEATEQILDKALAEGTICLKSSMAYDRSLLFEKVPACDAEEDLARIIKTWPEVHRYINLSTTRLQNYMMHHVCRLADERGLVFQFHTGIQAGNGNYIRNADPTLLTNLFLEYPNIKFDLFHIGYPYERTLSVLAKNFQNVYIDFCWAHAISPTAAIEALVEYLDAVPASKISGFGGDYLFVDGAYGHLLLARRNIARALEIKIAQQAMDLDEARRIARMLLHDNPYELFGVGKFLKSAGAAKGKSPKKRR